MDFNVRPGGALQGEIRVPGDKSISHRSIMLGALASGITKVDGFLEGEDSLATLNAFRAMGVRIDGPAGGELRVHGVGLDGLSAPNAALDLGNSGTSMRLMAGILAAQAFDSELAGDRSLARRPMARVTVPLQQMGAQISTRERGLPPLLIEGGRRLHAIDYTLPVASAQIKSCLLLAGLYAEGTTRIIEPAPTRDHTERMLQAFSYPLIRNGDTIGVKGGAALQATELRIPADISSAAFFIVAASIAPGSDVTLTDVGINPTRTGILHILELMGANIQISNEHQFGAEPVADLRVRYAPLRGIDIPREYVLLAIDEFPAIFIAAAVADGRTLLRGAEELRVKESDRIAAMATGLQELGIDATPRADGIEIQGGVIDGGRITSHGDHRVAMAFAIAGLAAQGPLTIADCANVTTSFPGFVGQAQRAGLQIDVAQT